MNITQDAYSLYIAALAFAVFYRFIIAAFRLLLTKR